MTVYSETTKVALLSQPDTYPEKPERIEVIQTHMSWVFLTERYAYKLKKPVRYDFLDFSTVEARRRDCEEEVRLNRRLAGDVYIGMMALTVDAQGRVQVGGAGDILDWLVKMRRLPAARMLDVLLGRGAASAADLRILARYLSIFYKTSPPLKLDGELFRAQLAADVRADCSALAEPIYHLPIRLIHEAREAQLVLLANESVIFDARIAQGRVIEGHGDLRPEHICLESPPVVFDCLEFNPRFRIVDAVDELAFLSLECERLGAAWVDGVLFASYAQETGDRPPPRLIAFYKVYRACLRAKLAAWHIRGLGEEAWPYWLNRAQGYLRLAEQYLPLVLGGLGSKQLDQGSAAV